MITFEVGYRYIRTDRNVVAERGHTYVKANSHFDAAEAFMATHPDGSVFRYEVAYVNHPDD